MVPKKDLKKAFELTIWPLRRLVLFYEANFDIHILINHALVPLKHRIHMKTLQLLFQKLMLEVLLELGLHLLLWGLLLLLWGVRVQSLRRQSLHRHRLRQPWR